MNKNIKHNYFFPFPEKLGDDILNKNNITRMYSVINVYGCSFNISKLNINNIDTSKKQNTYKINDEISCKKCGYKITVSRSTYYYFITKSSVKIKNYEKGNCVFCYTYNILKSLGVTLLNLYKKENGCLYFDAINVCGCRVNDVEWRVNNIKRLVSLLNCIKHNSIMGDICIRKTLSKLNLKEKQLNSKVLIKPRRDRKSLTTAIWDTIILPCGHLKEISRKYIIEAGRNNKIKSHIMYCLECAFKSQRELLSKAYHRLGCEIIQYGLLSDKAQKFYEKKGYVTNSLLYDKVKLPCCGYIKNINRAKFQENAYKMPHCPICNEELYVDEVIVSDILCDMGIKYIAHYRGFNWLRARWSKENMELDFLCLEPLNKSGIRLAIEVNDKSHNKNSRFRMYDTTTFEYDLCKTILCMENNVYLLIIYPDELLNIEVVKNKIKSTVKFLSIGFSFRNYNGNKSLKLLQ